MKKFIAAVIVLLVLASSVVLLSGCFGDGETPDESTSADVTTTDTAVPEEPAEIILNPGTANYKIVRAEKASDTVKQSATALWQKISDMTGNFTDIVIAEDWVKTPEEADNDDPEILLGVTNRPESAAAGEKLTGYMDFGVFVIENKICIYANNEARLADAVEYFLTVVSKNADGKVVFTGDAEYIGIYDKYAYKTLTVAGTPIAEFTVVIPKNAEDAVKNAAASFVEFVAVNNGADLKTVTDDAAPAAHEILFGATSRQDSAAVTVPTIKVTAANLVLNAPAAYGIVSAGNRLEDLIAEKKGALAAGLLEELANTATLDGKKVMFIGNSFIYYGGIVETGGQKGTDTGWFYKICQANGEKCTVYDYVWGGKTIEYIYTNYLKGNKFEGFDYVIFSEAGENNSAVWNDIQKAMTCFTGNPQIVYLCHSYTYFKSHSGIINALPVMQKAGVTIVDWGHIAYDVAQTLKKVPGGSLTYNKNSFIKNNGDTYHPNPLAGYIASQMCYCAITGKSAVGQMPDVNKIGNTVKYGSGQVGYDAFISKHYNSASDTNLKAAFASPAEIKGFQTLIDQYLAKWGVTVK